MKKPVLVLLAFLSLLCSRSPWPRRRQWGPAPDPVATPAPESVAQFLATLSGKQAQIPNDLVPAPAFMTGCAGSYQCPTGQICCYICGNPPEGDDSGCWGCVTPVKGGGCPQVY